MRRETALLGLSQNYRTLCGSARSQISRRGGRATPDTVAKVIRQRVEEVMDRLDVKAVQAIDHVEHSAVVEDLMAASRKGADLCESRYRETLVDRGDDRLFARLDGFGGKAVRELAQAARWAVAAGDFGTADHMLAVLIELSEGANGGADYAVHYEGLQATFTDASDLLETAVERIESGDWSSCRCPDRRHDGRPRVDAEVVDRMKEAIKALTLLQPSQFGTQGA